MANIVTNPNEIYLSTTRFPIKGGVKPALISTMPEKMVIGDYSLDDQLIASTWAINDQREGILCEEMIEKIHAKRCWWSSCDLRFKGHIILPPLATEVSLPTMMTITDGGMELWDDANTLTNWTKDLTAGAVLARRTAETHGGTYSARIVPYTGEGYSSIYQDASGTIGDWQDQYVKVTEWFLRPSGDGLANLRIDDGVGTTDSSNCTIDNDWHQLTVIRKLDASATRFRIISRTDFGSTGGTANFDDMEITALGTLGTWCNYNGKIYLAAGQYLLRVNDTEDGYLSVGVFDADITDLKVGEGNHLYIFLGDSDNYWYMDTSETLTETNVADATYGVHWFNRLFKMDSVGAISHSTDPSNATPSFTTNGSLTDCGLADNDLQSLIVYDDANGNDIIYAGCKDGLYAHDYTNAYFLPTKLIIPKHARGSKSLVIWRDSLFLPAGTFVAKYTAGGTATIEFVGLDRDDGLPTQYRGEIVKLIHGFNEFYALVDSSLVTGTGYSGIYAYDGLGWQCRWIASTANDTMHSGILSSNKLWFDHDSKTYSIPIESDIRNPLKVSTHPYASSSIHITPWFDAAWIGEKLALSLKAFCKDTTANETIVVKYRIDHSNDDIATGWTTLGTIAAAGDGVETEYNFASQAGVVFKAIQFKFDLARGATTTNTPDLQYAKLKFQKLLDTKWGWNVTVDCTQGYGGNTAAQLDAALKTIVNTQTLMEFTFRNESGGTYTYYVKVLSCNGTEQTGNDWRNTYELQLVAP